MRSKLLIAATLVVLAIVGVFLLNHRLPSKYEIAREFVHRNPGAELVATELIFDYEPKSKYSYLVKYKQLPSEQVLTEEFTLERVNLFEYRWCDDQSERHCK